MIKSVYIKNYILIDELTVNFSDGLNVITGETGAGKSILLNAIDLVFGAKPSKDIIKNDTQKAFIEVTVLNHKHDLKPVFENFGVDYDGDEFVISREFSQNSSRIRVNGTVVNQEFIKDLRELFLDIHSQHQTYTFIQPKSHIKLLDNYAKTSYGKELEAYKAKFQQYQQLLQQREIAQNSANATESQIDFLKFQINEIESANITDSNEENLLKEELNVLQNAETLKELTESSYQTLNGEDFSIIDAILQIKSAISKASAIDSSLDGIESSIIDLSELARDLSSELRDYSSAITNDTQRLNEIQERLYVFDKLKRKYGGSLDDVLETYDKLSLELNSIQKSEENIEILDSKISQTKSELELEAKNISEKRQNFAKVLSSLIEDELEKLQLPKSRFEIRISPTELSLNGIDNVEFFISTNISQDLSPLAKTASGGEISRVMLAIKSIFANSDDIDTVIFDEIDTGISGIAAQAVSEEISNLSNYRQIILITHQAIIAAKADKHFCVSKTQKDNATIVNIDELSDEEKVVALAKIASGAITDESLNFAKSLLSDN